MTKLFKRFHFPRKQQARQSFGSVSSSNNSSSIRMDSVRPSIYLHNQSDTRRSGAKKYTCSPKLSLYLQELQEGSKMKYQEWRRPVKRQPSLSLRNSFQPSHPSRFDMGDYLDDDQIRMSMFQDIDKRQRGM